ncbi:VOC family protein [Kineococcus arenarius]|uniref:VOC family protein n=1 Tax=unclassified Kineococcus TaxID=2621656 RepID=UPI003D7F0FC2
MSVESLGATSARVFAGLPGLLGVDHVAFTVSDLEACVDFLTEELGAVQCYREGPIARGQWMQQRLGVPADALAQIAMMVIGGVNVELFTYRSAHASATPPVAGSAGTANLRISVTDVAQAKARARSAGLLNEGPGGEAFITAYGLTFQLVPPMPAEASAHRPGVGAYGLLGVRAVEFHVADMDGILGAFHVIAGPDGVRAVQLPEEEATLHRQRAAVRFSCGPAIIVHQVAAVERAQGSGFGSAPSRSVPAAGLCGTPLESSSASPVGLIGSATGSPRNCDVGGHHIAFAVAHPHDVDAALSHLGVDFVAMGSHPETIADGPLAGDRWIYVYARAGLQMEILHMPDGSLPYERLTSARRVRAQPHTMRR